MHTARHSTTYCLLFTLSTPYRPNQIAREHIYSALITISNNVVAAGQDIEPEIKKNKITIIFKYYIKYYIYK